MEVKCPECLTIKTIDKTNDNIQVRCSKKEGGCGHKFYIKKNIVLKKQDNNKTVYETRARNPPSRISVEIDYNAVLKCMERGISTIENKPQIKAKKGSYYWDYLKWTEQFNILKTLRMGDEK